MVKPRHESWASNFPRLVLNRADHVPLPIVLFAISTFHPLTTIASERRSITNRLEAARARHELAQAWTRRFAREPSRKQLRRFLTFILRAAHIAEGELRSLEDEIRTIAGRANFFACMLEA